VHEQVHVQMKKNMDNFLIEFYNELKHKYPDDEEEQEEELWFSTKKAKKKEATTKKATHSKGLYSIIENFFNSLVDSEVEEQFITFDEFIWLDFWRGLPFVIWDLFETIWLYSADDEEEFENV